MCNLYVCSILRVLIYFPSVTLFPHPFSAVASATSFVPPDLFPPVPMTTSLLAPPVTFPTPHTGLTVIV